LRDQRGKVFSSETAGKGAKRRKQESNKWSNQKQLSHKLQVISSLQMCINALLRRWFRVRVPVNPISIFRFPFPRETAKKTPGGPSRAGKNDGKPVGPKERKEVRRWKRSARTSFCGTRSDYVRPSRASCVGGSNRNSA
jgi:hypothetical protein